jgi:flagellar biogenesis protein FliO
MKNALRISVGIGVVVLLLAGGMMVAPGFCRDQQPAKDDQYLQYALDLEQNEKGPLTGMKLPSVFDVIVRFFLSLVIVGGIIVGGGIAARKFFGGRYFFGSDAGVVKILSHRYLDPKKSIYIIEIASKIFILGATAENITLISEVCDETFAQELKVRLEQTSPVYRSKEFQDVLSGENKQYEGGAKERSPEPPSTGSSGLKTLHAQIEKIKRMLNAR